MTLWGPAFVRLTRYGLAVVLQRLMRMLRAIAACSLRGSAVRWVRQRVQRPRKLATEVWSHRGSAVPQQLALRHRLQDFAVWSLRGSAAPVAYQAIPRTPLAFVGYLHFGLVGAPVHQTKRMNLASYGMPPDD